LLHITTIVAHKAYMAFHD